MMMKGTTHSYSDLMKMRAYQNNGPPRNMKPWSLSVILLNVSYGNLQATVKYNDSVLLWGGSVG